MLPCNTCQLVRHTLAIIITSVLLANPAWLLASFFELNLTWLQIFATTALLQFNLAAAILLSKINYFGNRKAKI